MVSVLEKTLFLRLTNSFHRLYPAGLPAAVAEKKKIEQELKLLKKRLPGASPEQGTKKQVLFEVAKDLEELDQRCIALAREGFEPAKLIVLREKISKLQSIVKEKVMKDL
ncbi:MAG: hypothetical protein V1659_01470 [Candidatus Woesearchaeota archaeon]